MINVIERLRDGSVRDPDRIGSFILGTARWMSHDARRRERRTAEVMERAVHEIDVVIEPPEPVDADRLTEALGTLSERERAVVILSFHEGRSAREIGEAFGLTPGHVRVVRHRALGRLGEILGVSQLDQRTEGT
jgi:RNA polymerase sigma-70 factor (ECF subfamily)